MNEDSMNKNNIDKDNSNKSKSSNSVNGCKTNYFLFTDDEFPPTRKSLFINGNKIKLLNLLHSKGIYRKMDRTCLLFSFLFIRFFSSLKPY